MRSQNVSFLSVFYGFTIRSHFFSAVSACAELHAESERIVFVHFSRVYDTFSLFLRRFGLRGASCGVRTYRFRPFFIGLRYVFTFSAAFRAAWSLMQSQNVSFLSVFHGFTIRSHFFCGVSACVEPHAESERIVFVRFSRVYDTFSLFLRRFCPRGPHAESERIVFVHFSWVYDTFSLFQRCFLSVLNALHSVGSLNQ